MMKLSPEEELHDFVGEFYADPLGFIMAAFPWDTETSIQKCKLPEKYKERFKSEWGPDLWACEWLDELGRQVHSRQFRGGDAVKPIHFVTSSGHGIGKSTLTAWLVLWIMSTRARCAGVVTANTSEQLRTKTWAELGKWLGMCLTKDWFNFTSGKGSLAMWHKDYPKWRVDGQTCKEENSESFAGLHAASSSPFYIFDEASSIPEKIYEVRHGGTTDGQPMMFDFGNPTRNSGTFFENCVGQFRDRCTVFTIDSRDVAITNKSLFKQWVEDHGEDSDFVRVRVRGVFPAASSHQFVASHDVHEAGYREVTEDRLAPLVIGVDVARFGDNESVLFPRIGNDARSFPPRRYRGLDSVQLAGKVAEMVREFKSLLNRDCMGLFVDGTGLGAGVVDQLRHLGFNPIDVNFGSRPNDPMAYRLKVDEMWGKMRDAIKSGLCIPNEHTEDGRDLRAELTQREYSHTLRGQLVLESKKDMKERGLRSPDIADALGLTFAQTIAPLQLSKQNAAPVTISHEYDPLNADW